MIHWGRAVGGAIWGTVLGGAALWAVTSATPAGDRLAAFARRTEMERRSTVRDIRFRNIGPTETGGRIVDIAVPDPRHPSTFLVAYATGGLWRTEDGGASFSPLFEAQATTVLGAVATDPANPRVIWVGTGEAHASRSTYAGVGIYKSVDGGATWVHLGLAETHRIGRIVVHPTNPDIVYVAAHGSLWSRSADRGVYRTLDGGRTWQKILYVDESTSATDVRLHPTDPGVVYAATWTKDRTEWGLTKAGRGSGVWRSTDGGTTWTKLAGGLPEGDHVGRIGLGVCPTAPDSLYAVVDNQALRPPAAQPRSPDDTPGIVGAQLYRSMDRGTTWTLQNVGYLDLFSTYGHYFADMAVSPRDPDTVYLFGVPLIKSTDGGRSWTELKSRNLHADHHALWIDPGQPRHLVSGNDGGLNVSRDGGASWTHVANVPAAQFYAVAVDMARPYRVYGGLQDSGVWFGRSDRPAATNRWTRLGDGDGMYVQVSPRDSRRLVFGTQFAAYTAVDGVAHRRWTLEPKPPAGEAPDRFGFESPLLMSPHDPNMLYMASQRVYRSRDFGRSFSAISGDLTTNRRSANPELPYSTVSAIDESPRLAGVLYVGTDDGKAWVTRDAGRTWTDISTGLVPERYVSRIAASASRDGVVYLSQTGIRWDEWAAHVFRSEDYGHTWTSIVGNLPAEPVNVIREDPVRPEILYLGTDLGAWVSLDTGATWQPFTGGLPHVPVRDLVVHPREGDLVVGTHGRSIYVADIKPLRGRS
jgi:photosystem II stability/assembly factor-like uncharacterized protein